MVGFLLGGGFSMFSSLHGLGMDNVLAFEGVTASGEHIKVNASSTGDYRALFDVLCGAGFGLLVITSVTLRIYPISTLQLEDINKLWTRRWIFPAMAIQEVATFFKFMVPVEKRMFPILIFARSPPSSPSPGQPMLILTTTYFGPKAEAETLLDSYTNPDVLKRAITSETNLIPFVNIMDSTKMFDTRGGFKAQTTARCMDIPTETIVKSFKNWQKFGDETKDACPFTVFVIAAYNQSVTVINGSPSDPEGRGKRPFLGRDRSYFGQVLTWYQSSNTKMQTEQFITDAMAILREDDESKGYPPNGLPNNFRDGTAIELGYTNEQLTEIRRIHKMWNGAGVFYDILDDIPNATKNHH